MPIHVARYARDTAVVLTAGAAISQGQLIGINSSGQAVLADADAGTPIPAVGFALRDVASGEKGAFAIAGELIDSSWSWTAGQKLYLSGTAGGLTATAPSTATNLVQPVGIALSATKVLLNISLSQTVVQAAGNSTVAFG